MSLPIPQYSLERIVQRVAFGSTLIDAGVLRGGASAQVILLHVKHADETIQKYLLRVHSEIDRERNPQVANHEFNLLKILYGAGFPVAQPHYLDETGEILPEPYVVVDYIEGATDFSPRNRTDFLQQSAALLARIHQVRKQLPALNFLPDRVEEVQKWIDYQPEQLDEELGERQLRKALRTLFPLQQVNESTLLHGDFWPGNLIWRDNNLVGVIDWEDAGTGDPLSDLAITRLEMLWAFGQDAMQDFTRTYQTLMPYLDYGNLSYWDLFAALRPANQLADWVAAWGEMGRPDVTLAGLQQAHQWFVNQAFERIE